MTINCEIVSQDRVVFKGDADIVVLPGMEGQMGILPRHAPVLTALNYGVITVRLKGNEEHFTVAGGIAEVLPDKVTILADAAENVEEIDFERALKAKERAEERLKLITTSDADRYLRVSSALKRSTLRLQAVQKFRRTTKTRI
ncbi:MAG TPA: F0F1 ATP synthase subunit epsilon [Anaerolineaceae bacterium]|nr:F0F1 ATP synthase subunit epsilon [Anaerolineaceae bacterium]